MAKTADIINLLQKNQKEISIYIPSKKREFKFKQLTAGQQESFIQSLTNDLIAPGRFTVTLAEIIKENSCDPSLWNTLDIIDKHAIGISLRAASIAEIYNTLGDDDIQYTLDLNKAILNFNNVIYPELDEITNDNIVITLRLPSIQIDQAIEKFFKKDQIIDPTTNEQNITKEVNSAITNAFVGEVVKYIKSITIAQTIDNKEVVDFDALSIQQRMEIARSLPAKMYLDIIPNIERVRNVITNCLTITGVITDTKEEKEIAISFDAGFFVS